MPEERPKELCSECQAETGRAGKSEDSLYIEMQKGDRGPLCESCHEKWTAIVGRVYVRFDGPPAHESGRFIEVERDGASISFGVWFQDGDDWLLVLPDGADPERVIDPGSLEHDLHQILDVLDIGRVRKGRVLICQRVREGIEELEAEVDRLTKVLEWIAEPRGASGPYLSLKAHEAIALGAGRRRRIKS